jgi:hypothetical protein
MDNYKNIEDMSISDFLLYEEIQSYNQNGRQNDKARCYRKQVEYGAKKYIKP